MDVLSAKLEIDCLAVEETGSASSMRDAPRNRPQIPRSAVLEMVIFFAVALAWDFGWGAGDRFFGSVLHPFWMIVLLISVQYGTAPGLLATACSGAVLLIGNLPVQRLSQDSFQYWMMIARNPVLWLCAAVALGEISSRHQNRKHRAEQAASEARAQSTQLMAVCRRLEAKRERLEQRLAGHMQTAQVVLSALKPASLLDPAGVLQSARELILQTLKPQKFSVYILEGANLELRLSYGRGADGQHEQSIPAGNRLFDEIVNRRRSLCCASPAGEQALEGRGVLAGPLFSPSGNKVMGMLKIEELSFSDMNLSALATFGALCEWLGAAYSHAVEGAAVKEYSAALSAAALRATQQVQTDDGAWKELALAARRGNDAAPLQQVPDSPPILADGIPSETLSLLCAAKDLNSQEQ